jgi:hypothetical protein
LPGSTPAVRKATAAIAANTRWAKETNRTAATAPARAALERRFEDEVDPERILDPVERAKRVRNARAAFHARVRLAALKAQRAVAEAERLAAEEEAG